VFRIGRKIPPPSLAKVLSVGWLCYLGFLVSVSANALEDPTEPPPHLQVLEELITLDVLDVEPVLELNLSSILISPKRRLAVINGETVMLGGFINDIQVLSIEPGRVVIDNAGEQTQLFLVPQLKKEISRVMDNKP